MQKLTNKSFGGVYKEIKASILPNNSNFFRFGSYSSSTKIEIKDDTGEFTKRDIGTDNLQILRFRFI